LPLVKGFSIVGVRSGAELLLKPDLMREMNESMQKTSIRPVIDVFPVLSAKEAFAKLAQRKAKGKIVLDFAEITNKAKM
jgi:NADPH:quinone reductase-like Zn-dependent oxidoreductase